MRKLDPDKYSYPYHYHHNAEELLIILEGSATLRTEKGLEIVDRGIFYFLKKEIQELINYIITHPSLVYTFI